MNCLHCNKHMYNYYDGELSAQLKLEIDRHLSECPSCRFQYDLTLMENQVLRDTSAIPEVSPNFNKQVMDSITPEKLPSLPDNVLVISKEKRLAFRWSSVYTKSAIAVLLLALCFYVPGFITGGQNHQKLANNNIAPKMKLNTSADDTAITAGNGGNGIQQVESSQQIKSQVSLNGNPSIKSSSIDGYGDTRAAAPQPQQDASIPQPYLVSRMAPCEAGRSDRKESNPDTLSISTLSLKNIPEKYTLVNKVKTIENQIEYSYQSEDGAETINIQLITSPSPAQIISSEASSEKVSQPMMSFAAPAVTENVSREILVGEQKISVQVSGNISSDELNNLADQIVISKNP